MDLAYLVGIIIQQSENFLRVTIRNRKFFVDLTFDAVCIGILIEGSGSKIGIVNMPANPMEPFDARRFSPIPHHAHSGENDLHTGKWRTE